MRSKLLYGLIGYPVKHSLSHLMHNAAFRELNIDAEYRLFEVRPEELEDFLLNRDFSVKDINGSSVKAGEIEGFNITIPHKIRAKEILEAKFPFDREASLIPEDSYYVKLSGAVNTVRRDGDKLRYRNTDAVGFLTSLKEDLLFEPKDKKVLIIGCGGAGRAIIAGLSWINEGISKIYIYDVNGKALDSAKRHFLEEVPQASYLNEKLEFIVSAKDIPEAIKECQLLINASPVGMKEEENPVIDRKLLHNELSVYDAVYNRQTRLLEDAKSLGLPKAGGLGMLLYQGWHAFHFWMEEKRPVENEESNSIKTVMRQALNEALKRSC